MTFVDSAVRSALGRILQIEPQLTPEEAMARLALVSNDIGSDTVNTYIELAAAQFSRKGILNPKALEHRGVAPRFMLARGREGRLGQIIEDAETLRSGVSQYVLYGEWDSLIVLQGTRAEAEQLENHLQSGAYEAVDSFNAAQTILSFGYRVAEATPIDSADDERINMLIDDYDNPAYSELQSKLLETRQLLGHTWVTAPEEAPQVSAWVGIRLRGLGRKLEPGRVLDALQYNASIASSLTHLYHIEGGQPYHYLAKLTCSNIGQLNEATDAIGLVNTQGVGFEGTSLVIARGQDRIAVLRAAQVDLVGLTPDLSSAARAADDLFAILSQQERECFNAMSAETQLAALRSVSGLRRALEASVTTDLTRSRLSGAIDGFSHEITSIDGKLDFTGSVGKSAAVVEESARLMLSKLAFAVLGRDKGRHQDVLRMPTSKIRDLSLGKVHSALLVASESDDFSEYDSFLTEDRLMRFQRYYERRNLWIHSRTGAIGADAADEAFTMLRDAISIAGWATSCVLAVADRSSNPDAQPEEVVPLKVEPARPNSPFQVFISHSTSDREFAERLAGSLEGLDYRSWYADWEISAGDSITQKISDGLSASSVLVVVLSQRSVSSPWVRRELDTALMSQLGNVDVLVVPVLLENCEIPPLLRSIAYADFRDGFEDGFRSLWDAVHKHRLRLKGQVSQALSMRSDREHTR